MMGQRRVALVTGAGSGAGREICLALAVAEFRVVVADLNPIPTGCFEPARAAILRCVLPDWKRCSTRLTTSRRRHLHGIT